MRKKRSKKKRGRKMKISLVGLAGCGKTSIYATTFAAKSPAETKDLKPTVMQEVHRHPYLGLNVKTRNLCQDRCNNSNCRFTRPREV